MANCTYISGQNLRGWMTEVDGTTCPFAPFSTGATFAPVFTGYNTSHADFLDSLESFNLTYGSEIHEVNTAELLGATGTVKGTDKGNGEIVWIADASQPIGDIVGSGKLYDAVFTVGIPSAGSVVAYNPGTTPATDASDAAVGRLRVGQFQFPANANGEPVRITIPFITHGKWYGDLIGQSNS